MTVESDLCNNHHYSTILRLLEPKVPTAREMIYLLKYKKFVECPNVYSMCDVAEVDQTEMLVKSVIANGIQGSVVELGVWRGGMACMMKAILKLYEPYGDRDLYLFDTFDHFPDPQSNEKDESIHPITKFLFAEMPSVQQVKTNFAKFDLIDERVHFIAGLFKDTLPKTDTGRIAILRLDSDYYDSTMFSLNEYYRRMVPGGYVIIDDYNNSYLGCKQAVEEFRTLYGIQSQIIDSHNGSVYWRVD